MKLLVACSVWLAIASPSFAADPLPPPGLRIEITGPAREVFPGGWPRCEPRDGPDAPARAVRLADGQVELYASDQINRVNVGQDFAHLRHECSIAYEGGHKDDPASFDDRAWIASPWTNDGRTIWAIVHDEFHGNERAALCPTGRYMDCWYNALTLTVSDDGGRHFARPPGVALVAALPYRYDEVGRGHHGYFNPTNLLRVADGLVMFAFATSAGAQREGNCLLHVAAIDRPDTWRAWNGTAFTVRFLDPYTDRDEPSAHVCAPVSPGALRWPVTSLVRHARSGLYVAVMQDTSRAGGVFYATSPDIFHWSAPARITSAIGLGVWRCGDPAPIAYPSILDIDSLDRNFQTVGDTAELFETRFGIESCNPRQSRDLTRQSLRLSIE